MVRVWDPLVRIGHWLLVTTVAAGWFSRSGWGVWHEVIGYGALGVVGARILWGFTGSSHARFVGFVASPAATLRYAHQVLARSEPRFEGHNPLGAWMVIALLAAVILVGLSGWLYKTDRFWGVPWVERLHGTLADALLILIALHIGGVLYESLRHRENLIASMIHGRKRPEPSAAGEGI